MEAIFALIAVVVALLGLDVAAIRFGTDSRPSLADDHSR
jgi:hypothetical protein